MNTPVKERLLQFIDNQNVSVRNFCKEISVSSSYFTKNGAVSSDVLEKIVHRYPTINLEWIVTGRGKMLLTQSVENMVHEPAAVDGSKAATVSHENLTMAALVNLTQAHKELSIAHKELAESNHSLVKLVKEKSKGV